MTTKLNQIIAVEKGVKSKTTREFTDLHHTVQKQPLLSGISRTYKPRDDEGERLPSEATRVQVNAGDVLDQAAKTLTRLFDVVLTKDVANCAATADVTVDGRTLLRDVPVTYLLFLEKQLTDLRTFVEKLPVLDPAEQWDWSDAANAYATPAAETTRTKKVPRNHVVAEATDKHPAQVQVYTEDVIVGTWSTVKFSGALPAVRVREMLDRVDRLAHAVKYAREEANGTEVADQRAGEAVFAYLFG